MTKKTLSDRLTHMPRPHDPDRAAEIAVPGLSGPAHALVAAAGGSSPFLAGLISREGGWLAQAFDDPEGALDEAMVVDPGIPLPVFLRQAKRRVALLTALADLGGVWSLEDVTGALTQLADWACDTALKAALLPLIERGKLPGVTAEALENAAGLTVFAMGKMGAGELNYSSDIDLICLFDEHQHAPEDYATLRAGFVKAVRKMCSTLSDIGPEGYVFRTDLRLRPDAGVTPVAFAMGAAERYYESVGRTWERAAWIKARPAAGDLAAGQRFQESLRPFVWRKHLDFAAIRDAHDMRLAIRDAKGLAGPITLPGHDMKLGRGGIREIEFFTQTRQLIAGGRDETLRQRGTCAALAQLVTRGWVEAPIAARLTENYHFHRTVEHRLQMVQDAQTHSLPRDEAGFQRLAAMMDMSQTDLMRDLKARLEEVHEITERFFAPDPPAEAAEFPDEKTLARWRTYPAFRSARAQDSFQRLRLPLAKGIRAAASPDQAMAALDGFLSGLPAGVQLFALLEANPSLVDLLTDILTISPALSDYLSRNAQVLDAVIGGAFFAPWPGKGALAEALAVALAEAGDYEAKLDATRRWHKEWHFRIGVHFLRGLVSQDEAALQYADLARATVHALWPEVIAQFALRHGPPPGRGAVLLGMGSLGAGRLSPTSDLDMIVIYDAEGAALSDGKKPLDPRTYFARLTKAMVTALSARTAEGRLYEVDMRLRPSGHQGPVATSWGAFQDYQENQAWLWEHLALGRATVVAGPEGLGADVTDFVAGLMARPRDREAVLAAIRDMRARIEAARAETGVWHLKSGPGRLLDIELLVQGAALLAGQAAHDIKEALALIPQAGLSTDQDVAILEDTHTLASGAKMALNLVSQEEGMVDRLGDGAKGVLIRALNAKTLEGAEAHLAKAFAKSAAVIDACLEVERRDDGSD